ncbi:hypothetical protein M4578_13185 [Salipiger sp. P9]|uniref:hypothetical protein n=1 Tax=Salipiger pentaromativorans TaxID=2943193 RepID=UPI002157E014|nr:hypothetical protein [Salipiger pentaromativorans]MCR8548785.1 hypothetical protein [Salipiger pentaromativorans]
MSYTEEEVRNAALVELATSMTGTLTTTDLIQILTDRMQPTGHDAQIADGRGDTYFSQKVRNLVSHRHQATGLQARGLADYQAEQESWTITAAGRIYVDEMP